MERKAGKADFWMVVYDEKIKRGFDKNLFYFPAKVRKTIQLIW